MTAVTIGKRKLKITLDMRESAALFENGVISHKSRDLRRRLCAILKKAAVSCDFSLDCERIFVEIYPSASGGHIIYFTKSPLLKRFKEKRDGRFCFLMRFSDADAPFAFSKRCREGGALPLESSFHKLHGRYFLSLTFRTADPIPISLITEFADRVVCSETAAATVSEYGKTILYENAVEVLSRL